MSTKPLRTATWALLISCGVMLAATMSDPLSTRNWILAQQDLPAPETLSPDADPVPALFDSPTMLAENVVPERTLPVYANLSDFAPAGDYPIGISPGESLAEFPTNRVPQFPDMGSMLAKASVPLPLPLSSNHQRSSLAQGTSEVVGRSENSIGVPVEKLPPRPDMLAHGDGPGVFSEITQPRFPSLPPPPEDVDPRIPSPNTPPRNATVFRETTPAWEPKKSPVELMPIEPDAAFAQGTPAPFSSMNSRTRTNPYAASTDAQILHMQRQLEQLTQYQMNQQQFQIQRTQQMLRELQQATQMQKLQQEIDELKYRQAREGREPRISSEPEDGRKPYRSSSRESSPNSIRITPIASPKISPTLAPTVGPQSQIKTINQEQPEESQQDSTAERFSLQMDDAEITEVLEMLGNLTGLNVVVSKEVTGRVSANLESVTVEEALNAVLRAHNYQYEQEGKMLFIMSSQEAEARKQLTRKIITKIYRPNYISVAELQTLVTPLITPAVGKIAVTTPSQSGLAANAEDAGGELLAQQDALLVQDYPDIIEDIDKIILEVDVPPMQVVIEAMILRVRLDDDLQFGVNFALLNQKTNQLLTSGSGQILNATTGIPSAAAQAITPAAGQFVANSAGLKYGFISGDASVFVNALESISDTSLIASPQLRVLNKQKAQLIIGKRISYITRTFQDNQTIESVNFLDSGTRLILRPYVAPDGLVRMEVHPERSNATRNQQTQLPDLETTEVTTNVMVRDGTTVVIGGLIEEETTESYQRVPLLGAIPWLGNAFRSKSESTDRSELIVLITPRIIQSPLDEVQGDTINAEHQQRANHFRNNLSHINRQNLARVEYEKAWEFYQRGDYLRARTHIMLSLNHSKNNRAALRLRDAIKAAIQNRTQRLIPFTEAGTPVEVPPAPEWSSETFTPEEFSLQELPSSPANTPTQSPTPIHLPQLPPAAPAAELPHRLPPQPRDIETTAPVPVENVPAENAPIKLPTLIAPPRSRHGL